MAELSDVTGIWVSVLDTRINQLAERTFNNGGLSLGNKQYNLNFDKLCEVSDVGKRLSEPIQLKGGLLHRMYCLETRVQTCALPICRANMP